MTTDDDIDDDIESPGGGRVVSERYDESVFTPQQGLDHLEDALKEMRELGDDLGSVVVFYVKRMVRPEGEGIGVMSHGHVTDEHWPYILDAAFMNAARQGVHEDRADAVRAAEAITRADRRRRKFGRQ